MSAAELTVPTAEGAQHPSPAGDVAVERFEAAVAPLIPQLVRYFARRVQPTADAGDCAAETTLAMWRHRRRLPADACEQRAWAFGIARNILANHERKRVRRWLIDHDLRARLLIPAPEVSDEACTAVEALRLLPARDQELVRLIIWDDLTIAEAGAVLGMRADAARKRYERARAKLCRTYAQLWDETEG